MIKERICPICSGESFAIDVVDFSINYPYFWHPDTAVTECNLSSFPVYYYHCKSCNFTYAPEIANWSNEKLASEIYNDNFTKMDTDAIERRPTNNATTLLKIFPYIAPIRHLDFGGGTGFLSNMLTQHGWDSISFDPFLNDAISSTNLGKYNLITSFEVFEHATDPNILLRQMADLLEDVGLILFSTQVSDGIIIPGKRLDWWYVTPSTGHISLYSRKSLATLGAKFQLEFFSFNNGFHCFFKNLPSFAKHLFNPIGNS